MSENTPLLLIVDYNLTRIADVAHIARYARERHGAEIVLIRPDPGERDLRLCEQVIDLDPLAEGFVETAVAHLAPFRNRLRAGLVFSDNAVQRGAELLERLGLPVDSSELAAGAFSKHAYRVGEARIGALLDAQSVMVPHCAEVRSIDDLQRFADAHPDGFVVKPSCEGNNRGVVVVRQGDSLEAAFAEVAPYLHNGAICEEFIPFRREFSFDGVGTSEFITEKVSANGPYPVELGQILPARLSATEHATLTRTGRLANLLVGQQHGPFHNEIKLSDDGTRSAVVEPNRRPGGMKIWTIAEAAYGIDFYALWVDAAFGERREVEVVPSSTQAATVMLGVPSEGTFSPPDSARGNALLEQALLLTAADLGVEPGSLRRLEFAWLSDQPRFIPLVPRENGDFAAQACIVLENSHADIRDVVAILRKRWLRTLADGTQAVETASATHATFAA